jgi:hypothetical protein
MYEKSVEELKNEIKIIDYNLTMPPFIIDGKIKNLDLVIYE